MARRSTTGPLAIFLVLVGLFFAYRLYQKNLITLGDYYRQRYGKGIEIFCSLAIILSYLGWVAAQITALGLVFAVGVALLLGLFLVPQLLGGDTGRELHAVYHFTSMTHNRRIRVEVSVPDADPHLPSLCPVYPAVDWHEREAFDMFGLVFDGHPALTRILMPDDWPGHPQRKDYPLGGIPVEYKGASIPPPDQRRSYT